MQTGNLLLLAIVFRSRQLRSTVSNALIVNLAVADCLVGVFVLPAFAATVWKGGPPSAVTAGPRPSLPALGRYGAPSAVMGCPRPSWPALGRRWWRIRKTPQ